jgi:hypothetical protein
MKLEIEHKAFKMVFMVAFSQKALMHLSFPQTHEPFILLTLKI